MDEAALACSTSSSSQTNLPKNHQSQAQENTDFSPFAPDYKLVKAQQIISNLPKVKGWEFNYAYILNQLKLLEIDLILYSEC